MKIIKLTQGYETIVDDKDFEYLSQYKWNPYHGPYTTYAVRAYKDPDIDTRMHRVIMQAPKHMLVDHKNLDGLDNQRNNLRICTRSQNNANRPQLSSITDRKYKGVYPVYKGKKWKAIISKDKITYNLGIFETDLEAALAYNKAATSMYGEFASLNSL